MGSRIVGVQGLHAELDSTRLITHIEHTAIVIGWRGKSSSSSSQVSVEASITYY